jgi:hypothetical protein
MNIRKVAVNRLTRDEKGQALVGTLLLLLVGLLILTPTLDFMGTGIMGGHIYEQKIDEIYAADSGVEDALWNIRNDFVEALLGGGYDDYDYSTAYDYPYVLSVNDLDVAVTIQNIWIPIPTVATGGNIPDLPNPSDARQIIEDEKLMIIGYPSSTESTYTIKIVYDWDTTQNRDALKVKTIGLWVSPGFEYTGDCSLESEPFYDDPVISLYKGGYSVVWTFASQPRLRDFPTPPDDPDPLSDPLVRTITFKYTGPEGQIPELVSSWIDTMGVAGISYSWDDSIRLYKIESQAGGVKVEAYGAKTKFRKLKSTISSDYTVAGNNLMEHTQSGGGSCHLERYRNRLYGERDSTIQSLGIELIPESGVVPPGKIPEEAIIDDVYLYWTGWIDYHYYYYRSQWPSGWYWGEISALRHPSNPTYQQLQTLVETSAKVNMVKFGVDGYAQTVTTHDWQTVRTSDCFGAAYSWAYSCFSDVTDLQVSGGMTVREYLEEAMKSDGSGQVTFAVGHADEVRNLSRPGYANYYFPLYGSGQSTGYPLATPAHKTPTESCYQTRYQYTHSSWSLIIFYRSPALPQRQLYLFDDLTYASSNLGTPPIEVDFTISGFLAPPVITEGDKSHLTYLVGEGDPHYEDSYIDVNDMYLSDPPDNPEDNVFNSYSNAIPQHDTDGADIDTFELPDGCILPYDTSAEVTLTVTEEIYVLVYIVLSFRSDLTTGGIITNYSVKVT